MKHISTKGLISVAGGILISSSAVLAQEWSPDRPINLIVPWGAGGATDQVTRATAPILSEALGTDVVVVNQPGASGAVGTQAVLGAPADGYTLLANAIADAATYSVTGLLPDTSIDDWNIYLSVANVALVSVPSDSPYETFGDLLAAFQEEGSDITVATAGITSAAGTAIANMAEAGDFDYNLVSYDGGAPAVIAAASGEAMVTTQLAGEQAELIRGGRLRPLAVLADEPLEIEGAEPVPSITEWLPDVPLTYYYFGMLAPADLPDEVISTLDAVWEESVANSEQLREYAATSGAIFAPASGAEARERVSATIVSQACAAVEAGTAVNDPSTIGVDCETQTETPAQ